jgi:hypothetical protein
VVAEYAAGVRLSEISVKRGISVAVLRPWVRAAGIYQPDRDRGAALARVGTDTARTDVDAVLEQYHRGRSVSQLAACWGINPKAMRVIVHGSGGADVHKHRASRLGLNPHVVTAVVRAYLSGTTTPRIAAESGLSRDVVRDIVRRQGVFDPARDARGQAAARLARRPGSREVNWPSVLGGPPSQPSGQGDVRDVT